MRAVMREVLTSPEFWDEGAYFARYACSSAEISGSRASPSSDSARRP
jgi:hypothetical protein